MTSVAPALQKERSHATFPVQLLKHHLLGGENQVKLKERMEALVETDPIFDKTLHYNSSRTTRYSRAMEKQRRVVELSRDMKLNAQEKRALRLAVHDDLGTDLQTLMFIPNIRSTFTNEQAQHWLPKALDWIIIGAYAQTEMGHGSNVRALETTATFDDLTDELVIHSPTASSTKWWPGALGRTANHAIVYARLIVKGKFLGVHNIMVQIRDLETHVPLSGINVGDIGAKIGYNNQDNGFCRFDHVRVPRTNMAMKHAQLTRDGTYLASPNRKKASYASMTGVRASIVMTAGQANSMAATIAIRYSAVRRQGFQSDGVTEHAVLDYQMQQARVLPVLAASFAFHAVGNYMREMVRSGNVGSLHVASSGLKALCSKITCDNIEICRKACGGHGYLLSSGLVQLLGTYKQNATVEGENFMIAQQTTRQLLKMRRSERSEVGSHSAGSHGGENVDHDVDYVFHAEDIARLTCTVGGGGGGAVEDFFNPKIQVDAYQQRAAYTLLYVEKKLREAESRGVHPDDAWNQCCPDIIRASEAHCFYVVVRNFALVVKRLEDQRSEFADVLGEQRDLFSLWFIQEKMGDFFESGYLTVMQAEWIREGVRTRLTSIRPNAVSLCDAWSHSDFSLNSTLGRYDGQYIDALWKSAQKDVNPMNKSDVDPAFLKSLQKMRPRRDAKL